jgi:SAM-dependent methyltransferase
LLEVGCGPGRLPIGILRRRAAMRSYCGVDVNGAAVGWCQRHIESAHPAFQFFHLDLQNARYNPAGARIGAGFRLPFESRSFDVIYLYSVFSHMGEEDVERYLAEFRRLLAPGGRVFLTLFVEEGVPPVTVNPPDYRREWRGALHCVRYQRGHFEDLLARHSLQLLSLHHGTETDGQSAVTLA